MNSKKPEENPQL